jgi:hypothetical protein
VKKYLIFTFLASLLLLTAAFSAHKFYVAIHQINYNKEKKSIEITSRIFVDDLNNALEKKYGRVTNLGDKSQSVQDLDLLTKYLSEQLHIKVNGKVKPFVLVTSELENNVYICYLKCKDVARINTLEIQNKILVDFVTEQQNIIQTKINGRKDSLLLTIDEPQGKLTF